MPLASPDKGRQPVGLSIMLRTYFVQQWFNLSDPGVEEALYESSAQRRFVGVDLGVAPAPNETTVLRFRHLLEQHDLGGLMLEAVNVHLEGRGIKIATGMIVDATIIHAPSCSKSSGRRSAQCSTPSLQTSASTTSPRQGMYATKLEKH